jgi:hypothetical protein
VLTDEVLPRHGVVDKLVVGIKIVATDMNR